MLFYMTGRPNNTINIAKVCKNNVSFDIKNYFNFIFFNLINIFNFFLIYFTNFIYNIQFLHHYFLIKIIITATLLFLLTTTY